MESNKKPMAPRLPSEAKIVEVILTETVIGTGISDDDPVRNVQQYWTPDGELIVTRDLWAESQARHP